MIKENLRLSVICDLCGARQDLELSVDIKSSVDDIESFIHDYLINSELKEEAWYITESRHLLCPKCKDTFYINYPKTSISKISKISD